MKRVICIATCVFTIFLFGCSQGTDGTAQQQDGNSTTASADATQSETKIYSSVKGDVEIPANPQRIFSDFYIGEFIPLGITPVGLDKSAYTQYNVYNSEWDKSYADVPDTGDSYEAVTELNPDLIITINEDRYENYSKIAPTIYIPYGKYEEPDLMEQLGTITGTENKAQDWINSFSNEVENAKTEIAPYISPNDTFTTMATLNDSIYLYGENYGHGGYILYDELGLNAPPAAEDSVVKNPSGYMQVSLEALPEYVGNHIFICEDTTAGTDSYEDSSLWQSLPAYEDGNIYHVDNSIYYNSDPISLEYQLNEIVSYITGEK